jgi:hypothetical protein
MEHVNAAIARARPVRRRGRAVLRWESISRDPFRGGVHAADAEKPTRATVRESVKRLRFDWHWIRDERQVFWLSDLPTDHAFSEGPRGAGCKASGPEHSNGIFVVFVPDYSGGSALDFHQPSLKVCAWQRPLVEEARFSRNQLPLYST